MKVNGIWNSVNDYCVIFCIIAYRLNQYYKVVCQKINKADRETERVCVVLNLHK